MSHVQRGGGKITSLEGNKNNKKKGIWFLCAMFFYLSILTFFPSFPAGRMKGQNSWTMQILMSCLLAWQNHSLALKVDFGFYESLWQSPALSLRPRAKSANDFQLWLLQNFEGAFSGSSYTISQDWGNIVEG